MRGYEQKQYALEYRNYAEHCVETYSLKKVANFFKKPIDFYIPLWYNNYSPKARENPRLNYTKSLNKRNPLNKHYEKLISPLDYTKRER